MSPTPYDLMSRAALDVDVPVPDTEALLADARHRRGRRRARVAASFAVGTAACVAAAALTFPWPHDGADRRVPPAGKASTAALLEVDPEHAERFRTEGVAAVGATVTMGAGGKPSVDLGEATLRSLQLTSVGVVAAHTDGGRPDSRLAHTFVDPDGDSALLDLSHGVPSSGNVVVGTDATQPYVAFASGAAGIWTVTVMDVRTQEVEAEVDVAGSFTWADWDAPPVSLSGDRVWVGLDDSSPAFAWRTGRPERSAVPGSRVPDVRGGRFLSEQVDEDGTTLVVNVVDARTGEIIAARGLPDHQVDWNDLSPDGRILVTGGAGTTRASDLQLVVPSGMVARDLESGVEVELQSAALGGHGWTPEGRWLNLYENDDLTGGGTSVCEVAIRTCTDYVSTFDAEGLARGPLTLGGSPAVD